MSHSAVLFFLLMTIGITRHSYCEEPGAQLNARDSAITVAESRVALNTLVESKSFLSDADFLVPLKNRVIADNKKESLLHTPASFRNEGFFLGRWYCHPASQRFSYSYKSADRAVLFTIRGHFSRGKGGQWIAKITEASRNELFNTFGKQEYNKIQVGMSFAEVVKLFGVPPGAFYTGEATFDVDVGNKYQSFSGYGCEFERHYRSFIESTKLPGKKAWISNDEVIYVTFNENGKVTKKEVGQVRERHDINPVLSNAIKELMHRMKIDNAKPNK